MKPIIPNEKWSLGSEKNCDDVRKFLKEREEKIQRKKARTLQQAKDWLNQHSQITIKHSQGQEKLAVLNLYYRLVAQSEKDKRFNRRKHND